MREWLQRLSTAIDEIQRADLSETTKRTLLALIDHELENFKHDVAVLDRIH